MYGKVRMTHCRLLVSYWDGTGPYTFFIFSYPSVCSVLVVSTYFRTNPVGILITKIMLGFPTTVFVVNRTNIIFSHAKVSCLFSMKTLKLFE